MARLKYFKWFLILANILYIIILLDNRILGQLFIPLTLLLILFLTDGIFLYLYEKNNMQIENNTFFIKFALVFANNFINILFILMCGFCFFIYREFKNYRYKVNYELKEYQNTIYKKNDSTTNKVEEDLKYFRIINNNLLNEIEKLKKEINKLSEIQNNIMLEQNKNTSNLKYLKNKLGV